jgi:hypothetical protein
MSQKRITSAGRLDRKTAELQYQGHGAYAHLGAYAFCEGFSPDLLDEEVARATFLQGWTERGSGLFQDYGLHVGGAVEVMLSAFFLTAKRERLMVDTDRPAFMLAQTEDHLRLPKDKETVRIFAHAIVNDCVKHFCYQTRNDFTSGVMHEYDRAGVPISDKISRLKQLHELERALGFDSPVAATLENASAPEFEKLFKARVEGMRGYQQMLDNMDAIGLTGNAREMFLKGNEPVVGPDLGKAQKLEVFREFFHSSGETGEG